MTDTDFVLERPSCQGRPKGGSARIRKGARSDGKGCCLDNDLMASGSAVGGNRALIKEWLSISVNWAMFDLEIGVFFLQWFE